MTTTKKISAQADKALRAAIADLWDICEAEHKAAKGSFEKEQAALLRYRAAGIKAAEAYHRADELLAQAEKDGFTTVSDGLYLSTAAALAAECEDDATDYSTAPYWLHTDDGVCIAIHDASDLAEALA